MEKQLFILPQVKIFNIKDYIKVEDYKNNSRLENDINSYICDSFKRDGNVPEIKIGSETIVVITRTKVAI